MIGDRDAIANQLRNFADRVEDGELDVVEVELNEHEPPYVKIEGMNSDELHRLHKELLDNE